MKYLVNWVENHNSVVDADSEEEAKDVAQAEHPGDTFYSSGEPTVKVIEGPRSRLVAGMTRHYSNLLTATRRLRRLL